MLHGVVVLLCMLSMVWQATCGVASKYNIHQINYYITKEIKLPYMYTYVTQAAGFQKEGSQYSYSCGPGCYGLFSCKGAR